MKFFLGIIIGLVSFIPLAVFAYLMVSLGASGNLPNVRGKSAFQLPIYLDFISVMMTTITVVLAALAIGIAFMAIYTLSEIKQDAQKAATDKIAEALDEKRIRAIITEITFYGFPGNELRQQESDNGENPSLDNPDKD